MTISLLAVSTIQHDLTWFALDRTAKNVPVDEIIVMSDRQPEIERPYRYHNLPGNFGLVDYNIMIVKNLSRIIETDHVLITQYDGMATNGQYWDPAWLEYDYVGPAFSPWRYAVYHGLGTMPEAQPLYDSWPRTRLVSGSGGFSLRSRRLIDALCNDPEIQCPWGPDQYFIEDVLINFVYRDYLERHHGIRFAPLEVALAFGAEHVRNHGLSLGFHGWYNAPYFLEDDDCLWYYQTMYRTGKAGLSPNYIEWLEAQYAVHVANRPRTNQWLETISEEWKSRGSGTDESSIGNSISYG